MSEEFVFDLEVGGDIMDAVSSGFLLNIPSDASVKGNPTKPGGGTAVWAQEYEITGSAIESDEEDPSTAIFTVVFHVPADATRGENPDPNSGRDLKQWYRIVKDAIGNKSHEKYKATNFNLGRLKGLMSACGFSTGGGVNFKTYFAGSEPAVVGKKVSTVTKRSWYEGKAKDEITDFISSEVANG
jgi:hypothetical protein